MTTHALPRKKAKKNPWGSRRHWVPVTIKVPPDFLKALEAEAEKRNRNRSEHLFLLLVQATKELSLAKAHRFR